MKKEFILGPIQTMWLENLEKYPERQARGALGTGRPDNYTACCLGEGLLCVARHEGIPLENFFDKSGEIREIDEKGNTSYASLHLNFSKLGLITNWGHSNRHTHSLASLNDHGKTWPEIAAIIRANPEMYFTEPK